MDAARDRVLDGRVRFDITGAPAAIGLSAREQTAGRGQRDRAWHTVPGKCICATYYVRHRFALPEEAGRIPIMAGVAVAALLDAAIPGVPIGLKWPNDLLIRNKKAGGILVEMARAPDGGWAALVGVGVNLLVRELPPHLRSTATSLALEAPDARALPSIRTLARDIGLALDSCAAAHSTASFAGWIAAWRVRDASRGRRYETELSGGAATGIAEGIDDSGALLLRLDDGAVIAVTSASSLREVD